MICTLAAAVGYSAPARAQDGQATATGTAAASMAAAPVESEPVEPAETATVTAALEPDPEPEPEAPDPEAEQLYIVGSRRVMRSVLDSTTPVDMIEGSDFATQAPTDLDRLLRALVPSYNVAPQPISDAATLIRPANLRGLPPDSTVVLVNGKRRHRASVITFLGAGLSDGAQGVDISPIPALALKRVEVLRDGAAAQYGSDAIAGVMNFVLKDSPSGAMVTTRLGSTYEGDGTAWTVAGNVGVPLTKSGFFNFTIEYGNADPTDRSVQRADASALIAAGNDEVGNPAQIWGTPEVSDDLKLFANMGIDVAEGVKVYAFGNVARRDVLGGFFFRNPNTRTGVFGPSGRDPNFQLVDENGPVFDDDGAPVFRSLNGTQLLVGDLDGIGQGVACPAVPIVDSVPDADALALISDPDTEVGRNCFVFNERFPGGFTPQFGGRVSDMSLVGGVRGITDFGLTWDLSANIGQNETKFIIQNTVNASLGPSSPTEFSPGTYRETDQTFNLDFTVPFEIGTFSPLTVAFGGEYRKETFTIVAGDTASFDIGGLANTGGGAAQGFVAGFDQTSDPLNPTIDTSGTNLIPAGFSIGSNGFPGFSNDIAGSFDRENVAGYIDLAADVVEEWDAAGRRSYREFRDLRHAGRGQSIDADQRRRHVGRRIWQ